MMYPRSLLFVPGTHADRFDKARAADEDLTCIYPRQIEVVHRAFTPNAGEVARVQRIVDRR